MAGGLNQRSTTDLLVLMIAGTICLTVLLAVVGIGVVELVNPDYDSSGPAAVVGSVINVLIGLLAGFLAGRTDRSLQKKGGDERP